MCMSDRKLSDTVRVLIEMIEKEAALFDSFLDLLEQQQAALVANDLEAINRITEMLREKTVQNQFLNRSREEIIDDIRQANAIQGDLSVTRLLELVDEQQADQLRHLRQVIFDLHDKIADTRNRNAQLINRSRDYVARTMAMLAKVGRPDATYASTGLGAGSDRTVAVDWRV